MCATVFTRSLFLISCHWTLLQLCHSFVSNRWNFSFFSFFIIYCFILQMIVFFFSTHFVVKYIQCCAVHASAFSSCFVFKQQLKNKNQLLTCTSKLMWNFPKKMQKKEAHKRHRQRVAAREINNTLNLMTSNTTQRDDWEKKYRNEMKS